MFSGQNAWPVWVSMQSLNQCRPGAKGGFSMYENTGTPFQQEETSEPGSGKDIHLPNLDGVTGGDITKICTGESQSLELFTDV